MSDELIFCDALEDTHDQAGEPWKILLVDDEPDVHKVTEIVLRNFKFEGRPLEILNAYSGSEARTILQNHQDIAVALVDVVMESDDAGLNLVDHIRNETDNHRVRLVLRTGQPGQAPEEEVIQRYDIHDYKDKTELTRTKLHTLLYSTLRSYRDICLIEQQRDSLKNVISAITQVNESSTLKLFASAVLEQLVSLLHIRPNTLYCTIQSSADMSSSLHVLAATGAMSPLMNEVNIDAIPSKPRQALMDALGSHQSIYCPDYYVGYYGAPGGSSKLLYVELEEKLDEDTHQLLEIYCSNVASTYHTLVLKEDVEATQRELIYMLGEAVEKRSKETGGHVKRVALISELLAKAAGMSDFEANRIKLASPLHDLGKIAIPDRILNKPGKLDADEWTVMQTHAELGEQMLKLTNKPLFNLASFIAGQHHEKWDGSGYPRGLQGEEIHIAGRITALADVFDALSHPRCYKKAWPLEDTLDLIRNERGKHFDPALVDLMFLHMDKILQICEKNPD